MEDIKISYQVNDTEAAHWNEAYAAMHNRSHLLLATADHSNIATYIDQPLLTASDVVHKSLKIQMVNRLVFDHHN